jgi:tRNA threonylcarbamoyladenosine biosynthesis protein TsaE
VDLSFQQSWTMSQVGLPQLNELARGLAALAEPGMAFGLTGELGAGKTTLIQAWCQHLHVVDAVNSPSFGYLHTYQGQRFPILHADLYRADPVERITPELVDIVIAQTHLMLIEWPECWPTGMDYLTGQFTLNLNLDNTRQITYVPLLTA